MASTLLDHHEVRSGIDLLSAWIEGQMAYKGLPGLSFAIVHDQDLVWARGFGWADLDRRVPATAETLYRVASITKPFTATAILQLRDAGKLGLDDRVRDILPWFTPSLPSPDAPPITVRHLITHTAGLPRESPFPYWTDQAFPSIEQVRAAAGGQACILPTETRWKYSNLGLVVAGEVVAAVSGIPWAQYVRSRILEPLGMHDSIPEGVPSEHPRLARGYARRLPSGERQPAPFSDVRGVSAAAGLATTVTDLARFAMLQLRADGAPVLRGSTLREMQRVHWLEPEWQAGWGLGFHVLRVQGRTLVGHGGVLRGYRAELRFSFADRVAMIAMINADDGEPRPIVEKAFDWLTPTIVRAAAPPAAPALPDPAWQPYIGRYRNAWGDSQVFIHNGRLTWIGPALADPMMAPATLVPVGEHTFRVETKDGFGIPGERVVFEMDGNGRVARVKLGVNYVMPVTEW